MNVIECVPNISEGRSSAHVDAICDAVSAVSGVRLLDRSSDASHHRSVLTLAGDRASLLDAIAALFASAIAVIDLGAHRGEHPRIGAVDVVPFVPLARSSMDDCVALAREAGATIAERFGVPVYLYEEAARSPARRRLEEIRRGGLEALSARMRTEGWRPDFGPSAPHPTAGITAVGARRLLIAYNVNLATADVRVARTIAREVRESSGGLPFVKALGLTLADRGIVQVSMNLTNFEATSIEQAFDRVAERAAELGVSVLESEVVGLMPRAALAHTTPEHLRLAHFSADTLLEHRLMESGIGNREVL